MKGENIMMKFYAKVDVKMRNAEFLISAFFKNFNEKSSIHINGNEAVLEIYFENTPEALIKAIGYCDIKEFRYGKTQEEISKEWDNVKENDSSEEEDNSGLTADEFQEKEDSKEITKEVNDEPSDEKCKSKKGRKTQKEIDEMHIPALEDKAKKAESFEQFLADILSSLKNDNIAEFLEKYIQIAENMHEKEGKCTSSKILAAPELEGFNSYIKRKSDRILVQKYNCTAYEFAIKILSYKALINTKDKEIDVNQPEVNSTEIINSIEEKPEWFYGVIKDVEKRVSIQGKIQIILKNLGSSKKGPIYDVFVAAMEIDDLSDRKKIMAKVGAGEEEFDLTWMELSTLINQFISKYTDEKIKVVDFLQQVKDFI